MYLPRRFLPPWLNLGMGGGSYISLLRFHPALPLIAHTEYEQLAGVLLALRSALVILLCASRL